MPSSPACDPGDNGLRASVIVPVLNAVGDLPGLLDSLLNQSLSGGQYEVILVDNGSTDGTLEWLSAFRDPRVRVFLCHHRAGSYAARNTGLRWARADNIAFSDADGRPEPGWLAAGLEALGRSPRVGGRIDLVCSERPSLPELVDAARFLRQRRYVREGFGATANLFVRREVFDRVGLFDDRLISGGDHEFGQRATAQGFSIVYSHESAIRHPCRTTYRGIFHKAFRVGYGFGQGVALRGAATVRSVASRFVDRTRLTTGKALRERRAAASGPLPLAGVVVLIMLLHCITLTAIPFGMLSLSRDAGRLDRLATRPTQRWEETVAH